MRLNAVSFNLSSADGKKPRFTGNGSNFMDNKTGPRDFKDILCKKTWPIFDHILTVRAHFARYKGFYKTRDLSMGPISARVPYTLSRRLQGDATCQILALSLVVSDKTVLCVPYISLCKTYFPRVGPFFGTMAII